MGKTREMRQFEEDAEVFDNLFDGYVKYQKEHNPKSLIMSFTDFVEIVARLGVKAVRDMTITEFLAEIES